MGRRFAAVLVAVGLVAAGGLGVTPAAALTSAPADAPPQARAWILVDADTGAVLSAFDDHTSMRPASIEKIVTGLVAVSDLPADATVPVGIDAAGEEAAKINMKVGQVWSLNDTLHSLLMVSANDAAVALADRVGGSVDAFGRLARAFVDRLGAADHPMLGDPAGLDDSFSYGGGDLISAYDMALVTRAAMTLPAFRDIVGLPIYDFVGPDGVHHVLRNHNKLLLSDPTLVGVKPGYTQAAGDTYVAEATRNGRSMIVVELGVSPPTMYSGAEFLMSQGFATPAVVEPAADRLPPVRIPNAAALARSLGSSGAASGTGSASHRSGVRHPSVTPAAHRTSGSSGALRFVLLGLALALGLMLMRRRRAGGVGPPFGARPLPVRSAAPRSPRGPVHRDPGPAPAVFVPLRPELDPGAAPAVPPLVDWADWEASTLD